MERTDGLDDQDECEALGHCSDYAEGWCCCYCGAEPDQAGE